MNVSKCNTYDLRMSKQDQLCAGYESTDGQIDEQADRRTAIRTDRQNDSYIHVPPELRLRWV